jgi:aminoglycoside/choline kinase family phosphotransferase
LDRSELLHDWLRETLGDEAFTLAPASADASFRRYFRVTTNAGTRIVMDAPPEHEDCRPFIQVAALLAAAGLNAPQILAQDLARGFLLLSDLGTITYMAALKEAPERADELFSDASDALVRWQLASAPATLPPYDAALLRRELDLFPVWYIERHLDLRLKDTQKNVIEESFALIMRSNLAQPSVYVHRDYMPRNLMLSSPNPGILDFQDAVYGPITYDVASLFKDAFISWEEQRVLDWTIRYWEKARRARLPVDPDFGTFYRDLEWMGLQRHLKILGIFARLFYRDGKRGYLEDTPRFIAYVRAVCQRYTALKPLLQLFDQLQEHRPQLG